MNFTVTQLPDRCPKPRHEGLTMVMDKGLSTREAEDFVSVASEYVDLVKLGFGTAFVSPNLKEKLKVYKDANLPAYFGGTLFEAFVARNQFDEYRKILKSYDLQYVEVSDGSLLMPHDKKCEYIAELAKDFVVLSEVGSKDAEIIIPPYKWIQQMKTELEAGSWKVIAEAAKAATSASSVVLVKCVPAWWTNTDPDTRRKNNLGSAQQAPTGMVYQICEPERKPRQYSRQRSHTPRNPPHRPPRRYFLPLHYAGWGGFYCLISGQWIAEKVQVAPSLCTLAGANLSDSGNL